jgi:predicted nuclease of predicted toxin-antitoxin system
MSKVKIQLDEDVNPLLARDLRDRGYDAISASEANNLGVSDRDQLDYARAHGRLFLTHNRDDFLEIATEYAINQITYPGILYVPQVSYAQLLHRTLRFLSEASEDAARDVFTWIP